VTRLPRAVFPRSVVTLVALVALFALGGCGAAWSLFTNPTATSPMATIPAATFPTAAPGPTMAVSRSPAAQVTVSLGIYSGRPDPSWALDDAQAIDVVEAIAALPMTTGTPPEGGLGYHGFTIVMHRAGQTDETLVAYRASVAPPGTGPRAYRADPGRTVERLLLDTGRAKLTAMEISVVGSDLTAAP